MIGTELAVAATVGWDLQAVFEEGDAPTGEDGEPQRILAEAKVAVPARGHEEVACHKQQDGAHTRHDSSALAGREATINLMSQAGSRLKDKFALITGGNTGIGLATAQRFIEEGARVAITGRNAQTLAEAAKTLGPQCFPIRGDVTDLAELDAVMAAIGKEFGALDVVFANAGILHAFALGSADVERFDQMMAVNVRGAYFTVEKALPLLRPGASVIMNSSVGRHIGAVKTAAYAATKGAVHAMAKAFAAELAPMGIRVNTICPGPIDTGMWQALVRARPGAVNVTRQIPMGRIGQPREIANVALFLASDESSFITATELIADGGRVEASNGAEIYRG